MGSFSNYLENAVLNQLFNKTALAEVTMWIGVCTSDTALSDSATPSEPTAASYASNGRQKCLAAVWGAAASGALSNDLTIEFTTATQSWCTVYGFAGYDASAAGNVLFCATLTTARDITVNDSARFAPGELDVALD
jgi:hypothetical protein